MNSLMHLTKTQIRNHAIIWLAIIIFLNIVDPIAGTWTVRIVGSILCYLIYMFAFYSVGFYVFPKFWSTNRIYLFLSLIGCLIIYWINIYLAFQLIIPYISGTNYFADKTLFYFFGDSLIIFFIIASAGTGSFFNRYGLYKIKIQSEKEKQLLLKELNYLKNQFNSHITFNFLNFCYSKIHQHSQETAESIELFSDMLRYTLQTKPEEKVTLSNEITYIENFINLQKLLSAKVYAEFSYEGELNDSYILPRILITFVENAFKHGLCNNPQHPILINLNVIANDLLFTVANKINSNKKIVSSNTGLENVNQILDLFYSNHYKLKKEETETDFRVDLRMRL